MRTTKLVIILFAILPVLLFSSQKIDKISLQLSWLHQFEYAGFYAAKEKGFYKEAGLDLTFKEMSFEKKDSVVKDVLSGEITYAIDYSSIIKSYLEGNEIVFIANFFKHSPLVLVTQKDIHMPDDLKGKKFMGGVDALGNTAMRMMLNKFNINEKDFIDIPQTFNINDFIEKKVDATTIFLTNQAYNLNEISYEYNILNPEKYGAEFYVDNLFTSKKEVKENPERVKAFKDATIKGWQYALENKVEIVELILNKYNTQNKTKEQLLFEARQIESLMLSNVYPIGSIDVNRVKRIAETYVQLGIVRENIKLNIKDFIFESNKQHIHLTQEEKSYLLNEKQINVCIDPNWMPFEKIDKNGNYIGLTKDYIDIFQNELPIPIKLVKTDSWLESIELVKNKKCELLPLIMQTEKREEFMNFSSTYLKDSLVLVTKLKIPFIDNVSNLKKVKIAIVNGYAYKELLKKKYPNLVFVNVKNVEDGLEKVSKGELFGFVGALTTAVYKLQNHYVGELKIASKFDEKLEFKMAVREDRPELLLIFEKLLQNIDETTRNNIFNKYISISVDKQKDYTLLWYFSFLLFVIVIVITIWNRKLILAKQKTQKALDDLQITEKLLEVRNKELKKTSITDKLTSIYNRQKLDKELEKELYRIQRTKQDLSLIMLDIDFFKHINDTQGHLVGDKVLKEFSDILLHNVRKVDILGRWGGEEFLIICPNTNKDGAIKKAESIRKTIESHIFLEHEKLTASFGVTSYKKDDTEHTIINRVDMGMYKAKNEGRNRVVFFD